MSNRGVAMRRHAVRGRVEDVVYAPRREGLTYGELRTPAVAGNIADMTAQLESMAMAAGLDLLAYFLAMARAESEAAAQIAAGAASEETPSG
jgi:hypothetical protein